MLLHSSTTSTTSSSSTSSCFVPSTPTIEPNLQQPRSARGVLELTTRSACSSPVAKKRVVLVDSATSSASDMAVVDTTTTLLQLHGLGERPEELSPIVANILAQLTTGTVAAPASVFDCPAGTVPSLSIARYVERIASRTRASPEALLLAVILLDRISHNGLAPTASSVFRLYAACFVLAAKIQDDKYYSNKFYARVAGVPLEEMNVLERAALAALGFGLYVAQEEWLAYAVPVSLLLHSNRLQQQQQQQQQQSVPSTPTKPHRSASVVICRDVTNSSAIVEPQ